MEVSDILQQLTPTLSPVQKADLQAKLEAQINFLIQHNFSQLVYLLYRVDVSEKKLKTLLQQQPEKDAAPLIASLLIERQLQKHASKNTAQPPPPANYDAERW